MMNMATNKVVVEANIVGEMKGSSLASENWMQEAAKRIQSFSAEPLQKSVCWTGTRYENIWFVGAGSHQLDDAIAENPAVVRAIAAQLSEELGAPGHTVTICSTREFEKWINAIKALV